MENKTSSFLKSALNSGLIFGVILIILQLAFWMFNIMPVGIGKSLLLLLFNLIIAVVGIYWFTKSYRNGVLDGYINYGHAFLYGLTVFFLSTIILIIYNYIFNKFIDPEYASRILKATVNSTEEYMRSHGVPDSTITETIDKINAKGLPSPLKSATTSLIYGVIMGAIVSLISSAFAKKVQDPFKES
jgi:hypothetical protein